MPIRQVIEMTDPGQSIYLAGPIEADDDPRSWRNAIRERFPDVDWIDPMEWQDEWAEDPSAVWEREMETVRNNPVLVCNVGDEAPRTTGTHHEIREALNHGQPVAIVREGTVSQVYSEIEDVWLYDEVDHAVADLTCPDLVDDGLRADGGEERCPWCQGFGNRVGDPDGSCSYCGGDGRV